MLIVSKRKLFVRENLSPEEQLVLNPLWNMKSTEIQCTEFPGCKFLLPVNTICKDERNFSTTKNKTQVKPGAVI